MSRIRQQGARRWQDGGKAMHLQERPVQQQHESGHVRASPISMTSSFCRSFRSCPNICINLKQTELNNENNLLGLGGLLLLFAVRIIIRYIAVNLMLLAVANFYNLRA